MKKNIFIWLLFSSITFWTGSTWACDAAPPPVKITFDDSPDCAVFTSWPASRLNVLNQCEGPLSLVILDSATAMSDLDMSILVDVNEEISINLNWGAVDITWSLEDGRSGRLEVEPGGYHRDPCPGFGCDTLAASPSDMTGIITISLLCALGLLRRRLRRP